MTTKTLVPRDIPASGTDKSRFALASSLAGWAIDPAENVALCANQLVEARLRETPTLRPAFKEIALKAVARKTDGTYVLVDRPSHRGAVVMEAVRPGKFSNLDGLSGGALIDSLLLGEMAYTEARDNQVWDALLVMCEQLGAEKNALRSINIEVTRVLKIRAGLSPS